jgi:hypothetical protein
MGCVKHIIVDSSSHLLQLLGLDKFAPFREEFQHMLQDVEAMPHNEDWSTEPELLEVFIVTSGRDDHTRLWRLGPTKDYQPLSSPPL